MNTEHILHNWILKKWNYRTACIDWEDTALMFFSWRPLLLLSRKLIALRQSLKRNMDRLLSVLSSEDFSQFVLAKLRTTSGMKDRLSKRNEQVPYLKGY